MMDNTSLRDFASRTAASGRIRFGDLRRLQRKVLPNGIVTQEEAEALLDLDQVVSRADPDWPGWLSSALKAYAVSGNGIDPQKVAWLAERLGTRRTKAAQALTQQLSITCFTPPALTGVEIGCPDLSVTCDPREAPHDALNGKLVDVADEPETGKSVISTWHGSGARASS